jgi:Cysteine-rich CPXCG
MGVSSRHERCAEHRSLQRWCATLKSAVKRHRNPPLERLRRELTRLDTASIDRLYGLEPLWEPDARSRLEPEECVAVRCPYCGERLETRVDMTAESCAFVEDCEVCCRPIEFQPERDTEGALVALRVRRLE